MAFEFLIDVVRDLAAATLSVATSVYAFPRFVKSDEAHVNLGAVAVCCGRVGTIAFALSVFSFLTSSPAISEASAGTQWIFCSTAAVVAYTAWSRLSAIYHVAESRYSRRVGLFEG